MAKIDIDRGLPHGNRWSGVHGLIQRLATAFSRQSTPPLPFYPREAQLPLHIANTVAQVCGSPEINGEHLLFGSLLSDRDYALKLIQPEGFRLIRHHLEPVPRPSGRWRTAGKSQPLLPLSDDCKQALLIASEEAGRRRQPLALPHLLFGVFHASRAAADLLLQTGVNEARLDAELVDRP